MESALVQVVDNITNAVGSNHAGVLVADEHGMCLLSKGSLNAMTSGFVQSIMKNASQLSPNEKAPVVLITTDHSRVTISNDNLITLAVSRPV